MAQHNQSLQQTLDPVATLAFAKPAPASIAAEPRRYDSIRYGLSVWITFSIGASFRCRSSSADQVGTSVTRRKTQFAIRSVLWAMFLSLPLGFIEVRRPRTGHTWFVSWLYVRYFSYAPAVAAQITLGSPSCHSDFGSAWSARREPVGYVELSVDCRLTNHCSRHEVSVTTLACARLAPATFVQLNIGVMCLREW